MKFSGASIHSSSEALAAIQRRFAGHHSVKLWPRELYESLYSATQWPAFTVHKLRDPDLVKGVLVDHADAFEKAQSTKTLLQPVLGEGLITSEGEPWRRQRSVMAPAFKRTAIKALAPAINQATDTAMGKLTGADSAPIDVLPVMSQLTYEVIRCLSFGSATGQGMPYAETVEALRTCLNGTASNDPSTLDAASTLLRKMATEAIAYRSRSQAPASDLFSLLLEAANTDEEASSLSAVEFRDNVLTTIVAGHETTAVAATWTLFLLSRHVAIQDALARDIQKAYPTGPLPDDTEKLPLLRNVIFEAMRLFPPIPTIARVARQQIVISNVVFKPGDIADILVYPMHRNRLLWRDPDTFDPTRFGDEAARARSKFAYIPFGAGPRICIGSQLTHLQVSIILAAVLRDFAVLPVEGYEPQPQVRVTLQPHDGLPLRFIRRASPTEMTAAYR